MVGGRKGGSSVRDFQGKTVPFQELSKDSSTHTFRLLVEVKDVPSLGYEVLHVVRGGNSAPTDLRVNGLTLENSLLRVTVDPKTVCIKSLFHKPANLQSIPAARCGNPPQPLP